MKKFFPCLLAIWIIFCAGCGGRSHDAQVIYPNWLEISKSQQCFYRGEKALLIELLLTNDQDMVPRNITLESADPNQISGMVVEGSDKIPFTDKKSVYAYQDQTLIPAYSNAKMHLAIILPTAVNPKLDFTISIEAACGMNKAIFSQQYTYELPDEFYDMNNEEILYDLKTEGSTWLNLDEETEILKIDFGKLILKSKTGHPLFIEKLAFALEIDPNLSAASFDFIDDEGKFNSENIELTNGINYHTFPDIPLKNYYLHLAFKKRDGNDNYPHESQITFILKQIIARTENGTKVIEEDNYLVTKYLYLNSFPADAKISLGDVNGVPVFKMESTKPGLGVHGFCLEATVEPPVAQISQLRLFKLSGFMNLEILKFFYAGNKIRFSRSDPIFTLDDPIFWSPDATFTESLSEPVKVKVQVTEIYFDHGSLVNISGLPITWEYQYNP